MFSHYWELVNDLPAYSGGLVVGADQAADQAAGGRRLATG